MEIKTIFKKNAPLILTLVFCISVVSIIYSNTLNGEFIYDDKHTIVENQSIRMESITVDSILTSLKSTRPVPMLSFALNYYFAAYNVQGYHIVNIIIHIINTLLIFFLCRKLLTNANYKNSWELKWLPVLAASLWAVNPVHTQSVTYIVQRMNSMATMFYIVSFLCYLTARSSPDKKKFFVVSFIIGLFAVLSKEMAITLPVFILLYEWLFFRNADTGLLKKYTWQIIALAIVIPVAGYLYIQSFYPNFITTEYANYNFNMLQRCLTQPRVVIYYIGLMLIPHPSRLILDYDFPISTSLMEPFTTLPAIVFILLSIAGSVYLIFKKEPGEQSINKLIAFAILWYLGNLLIESSVIPLDMVYEHRTYLPSILLFLAISILFAKMIKNRILLVSATIICLLICSYWTMDRNKIWQSKKVMWHDTAKKSPNIGRPYLNIGKLHFDDGDYETAFKYFSKGLTKQNLRRTVYIGLYSNIGVYYLNKGEYIKALGYYDKAHNIDKNNITPIVGIGTVLVKLKKYDIAEEYLTLAVKKVPDNEQAYGSLGEMYLAQNLLKKALENYNTALKLNPEDATYYSDRGEIYSKMGKTDLAILDLIKAKSIDNKLIQAYLLLGIIYTSSGEYDKATAEFKQAVKMDNNCTNCYELWASLLFKTRNFEEAINHYKKILEIDPQNMKAYRNIGIVLSNTGNIFGALVNLNKAQQLEPENNETKHYYNLLSNAWKKIAVHERIDIVNDYINENQKEAFAFAGLGRLHFENKEYSKSIKNWTLFLTYYPDSFITMNHIAVCHMTNKNFTKAADIYNKMIDIKPDNQIVYYNLACAYSASGQIEQSVKALKGAINNGFSDIDDMKKDPDLSKLMTSEIGKNFLRELNR